MDSIQFGCPQLTSSPFRKLPGIKLNYMTKFIGNKMQTYIAKSKT